MTRSKIGPNYTDFYQYEEGAVSVFLKRIDNSGRTLYTHTIKFNSTMEAKEFFDKTCS